MLFHHGLIRLHLTQAYLFLIIPQNEFDEPQLPVLFGIRNTRTVSRSRLQFGLLETEQLVAPVIPCQLDIDKASPRLVSMVDGVDSLFGHTP